MNFTQFDFNEKVLGGIRAAQYTECMPVQEKVFTHALGGADVAVQSQTGSGKTAAFLLTILNQYVLEREETEEGRTKALIIVPTRELAVQIETDAKLLASAIGTVRIGAFFGGVGYQGQDKLLDEGVDIVIGTPGRLIDYSKMGKLDFKQFTNVVIDEADRMFDMGFYPDICSIMNLLQPREKRQTMLFSATLSYRAKNLSWDFMNNPVEIEIEPERVTVEEIHQELYHVSKNEKNALLLYLLGKYKPGNAIIFTNKKIRAVELAKRLRINGFNVQFLMGDLPQKKRLQVIDRMKAGEIDILVATDVAARGLHVNDLDMVINYDIPEDFENYVHRIGRTARAGKSGVAITLACEEYVYGLEPIQDFIGMKIPVVWVDDQDLASVEDKSSHIHFRELVRDENLRGAPRSRGSSTSRAAGKPRSSEARRPNNRRSSGRKPASKPSDQRKSPSDQRKSAAPASTGTRRPAASQTDREKSPKHVPRKPVRQGSANKPRSSAKQPRSDYAKISSMPLEERLAYYKKQYGQSEDSGSGTKTEKTPSIAPQKTPQKKQVGKQATAAAEAASGKEKRRGGFLKRILGRSDT